MTAPEWSVHECGRGWCEYNGSPHASAAEHNMIVYTLATHPSHYPGDSLTVGAGVSWDEREDGDRAAVVVHIYGGNWDADAFLRLDEARNLRTLLDDAIGIVAGVISGPR